MIGLRYFGLTLVAIAGSWAAPADPAPADPAVPAGIGVIRSLYQITFPYEDLRVSLTDGDSITAWQQLIFSGTTVRNGRLEGQE